MIFLRIICLLFLLAYPGADCMGCKKLAEREARTTTRKTCGDWASLLFIALLLLGLNWLVLKLESEVC